MNKTKKLFKVAFVVRQKNGALYKAMKDRGWNQKELSEFLGITQQEVGRILNFTGRPPQWKKHPARKKKFKQFQERLLDLTGKSFDDLFPDEVYNDEVMENASSIDFFVEKDLSVLKLEPSSEITLIESCDISTDSDIHDNEGLIKALECLSDRQKNVIHMRFFENMTLRDVGKKIGVTGSRIRVIEAVALRKLRSPSSIRVLMGESRTVTDGPLLKTRVQELLEQMSNNLARNG